MRRHFVTKPYVLERDSHQRICARVTPNMTVGIKMLASDHHRRVESNIHAYVVVDLMSDLGPWRIRDITLLYNPQNQVFFVRYKQWQTHNPRRDHEEWLDIAGPQDTETRERVQDIILGVFHQIREESAAGILLRPKQAPALRETIGDNPEVAARLERLKKDLTSDEEDDAACELEADDEPDLSEHA